MNDLRVEDVMTNLVVMLYPNDSVHEAAGRLARNRISGAPVVVDGKVVGMISEADLIYSMAPPARVRRDGSLLDLFSLILRAKPRWHADNKRVEGVMATHVIKVNPKMSIWTAAGVMDRFGIKRVPVVDENDYLVGILSRADLVKVMARDDKQIKAETTESILSLGEQNFRGLDIEVQEGVATITGLADRKTTRDLAVQIAARQPGVVEVKDELNFEWDDSRVEPPSVKQDPKYNWVKEAR